MTTTSVPFFAERKRIVGLAGKYQLPAIYYQKEFVDEGRLMSYGADYVDLFRKSAHYVEDFERCQTGRFAGAAGDEGEPHVRRLCPGPAASGGFHGTAGRVEGDAGPLADRDRGGAVVVRRLREGGRATEDDEEPGEGGQIPRDRHIVTFPNPGSTARAAGDTHTPEPTRLGAFGQYPNRIQTRAERTASVARTGSRCPGPPCPGPAVRGSLILIRNPSTARGNTGREERDTPCTNEVQPGVLQPD